MKTDHGICLIAGLMLLWNLSAQADCLNAQVIEVTEGSEVALNCVSSKNFKNVTQYNWTKDGRPVGVTSRRYIIGNANRSQSGQYVCVSRQSNGSDVMESIKLVIQYAPVFKISWSSLIVSDNRIAQLTCRSEGEPAPTLKWERHGVSLNSGGAMSILHPPCQEGVGHLFVAVTREADRGEYVCVARNKLGVSRIRFLIREASKSQEQPVITWETEHIVSIRLGLGITCLLILVILLLLCRAQRLLKNQESVKSEAHDNIAIDTGTSNGHINIEVTSL